MDAGAVDAKRVPDPEAGLVTNAFWHKANMFVHAFYRIECSV
jgi:hypothetical protein